MLMYIQRQSLYDDHMLGTEALNAWDRIGKVGKKIKSFTNIIQIPEETFTGFLQRLTSAVNRMIDSKFRS